MNSSELIWQQLALTADDWGLSPGINDGILELVRKGVIRRVSLMANCEHVTYRLDELKAYTGIELGLHFNLTYGKPLSKRSDTVFRHESPGRFLVRWLAGQRFPTPEAESASSEGGFASQVRFELRLQIERLRELGVPLVYMDGHHHIHLAPGMLDEVADILQGYGIRRVRIPYDPRLWLSAKAPLNLLSLLALRAVKRWGLETAKTLYPQTSDLTPPQNLSRLLAQTPPGTEVIFHPAKTNDLHSLTFADPYTAGRVTEYEVLMRLADDPPSALKNTRSETQSSGLRTLLLFLTSGLLLALGCWLRFSFPELMEWKEDEQYNYFKAVAMGRGEPWSWRGMNSGVFLANPGMSVWVFVALARVFQVTEPTELVTAVGAFNLLGVLALVAFALLQFRTPSERPSRNLWLWAAAFALVNPFHIFYARKFWPEPILTTFCVFTWIAWWNRNRSAFAAFLWGAFGALLGQIHLSGFFISFAVFLTTLWIDRPALAKKRWLIPWVGGSLCGAWPLIPWILDVLKNPPPQSIPYTWLEPVQIKYWVFWLTDAMGLHLGNPLGVLRGNSKWLQISEFIRYPLIGDDPNRPTYLNAVAHATALISSLWLLLPGAKLLLNPRHRSLLLDPQGGSQGGSVDTQFRALFWSLFGVAGILLTLTGVQIRRYYLAATFPWEWILLILLARHLPKKGNLLLTFLLVAQAFMSFCFVDYLRVNRGAPQGDYGVSYEKQVWGDFTRGPVRVPR